jgi:hypothetical protein
MASQFMLNQYRLTFALCALTMMCPICGAQQTKTQSATSAPARPAPARPAPAQSQRSAPAQPQRPAPARPAPAQSQRSVPAQPQRPAPASAPQAQHNTPSRQNETRPAPQPPQRNGQTTRQNNQRPPNASQQQAQRLADSRRSPSIPQGVRPRPLPGGGSQYTDRTGKTIVTNSKGQVTEFRDQSHVARYGSRGEIQSVQTSHNGTTTIVTHHTGRQPTVQTKFADGSRVVSYGPHNGFAERPIPGRPGFVARTYTVGGATHVSVYKTYSYRNYPYYRYIPAVYYRPAFYAWVLTPWTSPIVYSWGIPVWGGLYGAYFTPYESYPTADLWLTDYVLNADLQQAYAAHQANGDIQQPPPSRTQSELDPDVKALIAQQLKIDIAEMQASSSSVADAPTSNTPVPADNALPDVLKPNHSAFVVSTDMQLNYGDNQTCAVTAGDILFRKPGSTVDASGSVEVTVVGRKPGSCDLKTTANVTLATLQEMNNQFEQQMESGMVVLAAKAGKGPFPASPDAGRIPLAAGQTPAPAQNVGALLNQNLASGSQAEAEVASAAGVSGNQ